MTTRPQSNPETIDAAQGEAGGKQILMSTQQVAESSEQNTDSLCDPHETCAGRRHFLFWGGFWVFALSLRILVFLIYPGVLHADATFQFLEPAHRLAFGYGVVTWEWREGIRSWVLPATEAVVMRLSAWMGPGSSGYLYATGFAFSLFSLTSVWFGYAWAKRVAGRSAGLIAVGALAIHFWMVYMATQTFSEVAATGFLLPALYFGYFAAPPRKNCKLFLAGLLLGVAIGLRIQLIPVICIVCLWFFFSRRRQSILAFATGFLLSFLAFGITDLLTGKFLFGSYILYFRVNFIADKASLYGVYPWYWYFKVLILFLGPAVLLLWQGARRTPFLATIAFCIFLFHSFIAHKEIRYLYPILPMLLTLAAIGAADYATMLGKRVKRLVSLHAKVGLGIGFFTLSSLLVAITSMHFLERQISSQPTQWIRPAYIYLSRDPNLCGLGLFNISWSKSGGVAYLHRNVQILPLESPQEVEGSSMYFNNLFAPEDNRSIPAAFHLARCWHGVCLYQRPGGCSAAPEEATFNGFLRRRGE